MKRQRYLDVDNAFGKGENKTWTWEELEEYFKQNYDDDYCLGRYVEETRQNEPYDYDTMYMTKEDYDEWVVEDAAYNWTYDTVRNYMKTIWV